MCYDCGAPLTMSNGCKENHENLTSVELNGGDPNLPCKFCGEKQENESRKQTGLSPCPKQIICPAPSLTSSDSTVSCCSKVLTLSLLFCICF